MFFCCFALEEHEYSLYIVKGKGTKVKENENNMFTLFYICTYTNVYMMMDVFLWYLNQHDTKYKT